MPESMLAPRSWTVWDIVLSLMIIGSKVPLARGRVELSQMNFVFDALNFKRLLEIHWLMPQ
jgi:hypothetical protein